MVWNILRLMFHKGLSIKRWNNFPRVVDTTHMDNLWMTLHVALFLAYHEERLSWKKLDKLFLMKYTLFESFNDLILSDIYAGTKINLQKQEEVLYHELQNITHSYIHNFPGKVILKNDYLRTVKDEAHETEKALYLASKKYVWLLEATPNAKIFPDAYAKVIGHMKKYLAEASEDLKSLEFLRYDKNSQKYLLQLQRLCFCMRWNRYRRLFPISVMAHQAVVMYLSYCIAIQEKLPKKQVEDMMLKAIYHDVPEIITGDVVSPTKTAVDGLKEVLGRVEEQMVEEDLFVYLDQDYENFVSPYILDPFSWENGKKVKYCDILSAYIESLCEKDYGNTIFFPIEEKVASWCDKIDSEAVKYIREEIEQHFSEEKEDLVWEYKKKRLRGAVQKKKAKKVVS